ncbi:MAG: hypothetical protein SF028_12360, partial [Candidatus Sumerlaeia bacterium]|nr:hypothetical protein [Candidatus Sumerlaeia bacterium]
MTSTRAPLAVAAAFAALLAQQVAADTNITIVPGSVAPIGASPLTASTIGAADISIFLQNSGSLVITTSSAGGAAGTITIAPGALIQSSSGNSLEFRASSTFIAGAGSEVSIAGPITVSAGDIDVSSPGNGAIASGTSIRIQPSVATNSIGLGDGNTGDLSLTQSEFNAFATFGGPLFVGPATNPQCPIEVTNLQASFVDGDLVLNGASLSTGALTAFGLDLTAATGDAIATGSLFTLSGGDLKVSAPNGEARLRGISTGGNGTPGGDIRIESLSGIFTWDIDASSLGSVAGNITLISDGPVSTGGLGTSGDTGGEISVTSLFGIKAGTIDSSGSIGNGGNVTLDPPGDVSALSIFTKSFSGGRGGEVVIESESNVRLLGAPDGFSSIDTSGPLGGGPISITFGANTPDSFIVGDSSFCGSEGNITDGTNTFSVPSTISFSTSRGQIAFITDGMPPSANDDGGSIFIDSQFSQDAILYEGATPGVGATVLIAGRRTQVGDNVNNRAERGLLGFATAIPGAEARTAQLRLTVDGKTGDVSGLGDLEIYYADPFYGTTAGWQASDFQAAPSDASPVATIPNSALVDAAVGDALWVSIDPTLVPLSGNVQFRLQFANGTDGDNGNDNIRFGAGGQSTSNRHERSDLVVEYDLATTNGCGLNPSTGGSPLLLDPLYSLSGADGQ